MRRQMHGTTRVEAECNALKGLFSNLSAHFTMPPVLNVFGNIAQCDTCLGLFTGESFCRRTTLVNFSCIPVNIVGPLVFTLKLSLKGRVSMVCVTHVGARATANARFWATGPMRIRFRHFSPFIIQFIFIWMFGAEGTDLIQ